MKNRLLAALLLFCCGHTARAITLYSVTDLGDFPGGAEQSQAFAINAAGQVVGVGQNSTRNRAFVTSFHTDGTVELIDLGALPNLPSTRANGINALGQIVGASSDGDKTRSFVWTPAAANSVNGMMLEVEGLPGERNHSTARSINALGQIVGDSFGHAYLWTPSVANGTSGTAVDLGTVPGGTGGSFALDVNDVGRVVGLTGTSAGQHAFLWTPTTANGSAGSMIDLGTLPGSEGASQALAINEAGAVVGNSVTATAAQHAFLWTPDAGGSGAMLDLGDLEGGNDESSATGINNANKVVGFSNSAGSDHAFVWTSNDGMLDLNTLSDATGAAWTVRFAQDINDRGQIVGWGTFDPDGPGGVDEGTHAYRLEPVAEITPGQLFPRREGNTVALYFVGGRGVGYRWESSASPAGPWEPVGVAFTGTGGISSLRETLTSDRSFWRVVELPNEG